MTKPGVISLEEGISLRLEVEILSARANNSFCEKWAGVFFETEPDLVMVRIDVALQMMRNGEGHLVTNMPVEFWVLEGDRMVRRRLGALCLETLEHLDSVTSLEGGQIHSVPFHLDDIIREAITTADTGTLSVHIFRDLTLFSPAQVGEQLHDIDGTSCATEAAHDALTQQIVPLALAYHRGSNHDKLATVENVDAQLGLFAQLFKQETDTDLKITPAWIGGNRR